MKNQYFGDINDYKKYGLLRILTDDHMRLAVCWMLTDADHRADGKFISYLQDPVKWEHLMAFSASSCARLRSRSVPVPAACAAAGLAHRREANVCRQPATIPLSRRRTRDNTAIACSLPTAPTT